MYQTEIYIGIVFALCVYQLASWKAYWDVFL